MTESNRRCLLINAGLVGVTSAWGALPAAATCLEPADDAVMPPPDPRLPDVGAGQKFSADGQAQRWPGCTLISAVRPSNPLFDLLCDARDRIRATPAIRTKLTWMPEQSYHMTVCDLVNVAHRGSRGDWPAAVPLNADLAAACRSVGETLRRLPPGDPRPFRMRLDTAAARTGLRADGQPRTYILWLPADREVAERLKALRDRVFNAVGIHHPGESDYTFHTTLSYPVGLLTRQEAAVYERLYVHHVNALARRLPIFEVGTPDFCLFESMYLFEPQFGVS